MGRKLKFVDFDLKNAYNNGWVDVTGYPGIYIINSIGEVRSVRLRGRLMTPQKNKLGYMKIGLTVNWKVKSFLIHRLVISSFTYPSDLFVDHINNIRDDNRLENLRYCTTRENAQFTNRSDMSRKSSKYVGVSWSKNYNKWVSRIRIGKTRKHLGSFRSEEDAHHAYVNANKLLTAQQ